MASLQEIVGRNIAAHRAKARMSQEALAAKLSVQRVTVARWEGGTSLPRGEHFESLGKLLGLAPWKLCIPPRTSESAISRAQEEKVRDAMATISQALGL